MTEFFPSNIDRVFAGKAWVVAVNMGYGHQRTAYPLRHLTPGGRIINANSYEGISEKDRKIWETKRRSYEFISRFKKIPLIGEVAFLIFNEYQKIFGFYPRRDLSRPNFAVRHEFSLIRNGWGKDLIEKIKAKPLPLITTFFIPAFMAEFFKYPGKVYCVVCDADISRTWASFDPGRSAIKYFAPTSWVVDRLKLYGVREENVVLTGYPLPIENIGSPNLEVLKEDLRYRMLNLDPERRYLKQYKALVQEYLGELPESPNHPLTIMFAVGGAGAQKESGIKIVKSLAEKIVAGKAKIILVAGIHRGVKEYFEENIRKMGLEKNLNRSIEIIFAQTIEEYFKEFNQKLRQTDILWTKPSELSFYCALGLPILIAPPIGYQEDFNKRWLLRLGSGIVQESPEYTNQWLFDFLEGGRFAEAAMQGFVEAEKLGTIKIQKIISENS